MFVPREVFDVGCAGIAEVLGKSPGAVQWIGHRARRHVE
ncbi:hypothetical protein ABZV75_11185 [Streptomyces flaveolus]